MENYILTELSEDYAKEICNWRYEGEYSIYDLPEWDTVVKSGFGLSIEEKRRLEFIAILLNNELVSYGRISLNADKAYIGVGLKPSFCGKGYGKSIMRLLIEECKKRFPNDTMALEVRSFNKRAVNCYRNVGFRIKDKYMKRVYNNSEVEFYYMEYIG
ncbi:GNAT family N-acetyltransferase [Proteiniborus sp. MB09-C3]|uniref:GNAT family N-acetyltransferase n=1 Tax=Proteiniborus sp. MB09-C3 TaxID=3050072 RepID=UPI002555BB1D|nr:GNAT family N-acetyltransferase [Proteiniborus sp. MB09-C3]WIV11044.1 GNAT family N-acetyltransferase [Proteiniborus sp. MB09-C3]